MVKINVLNVSQYDLRYGKPKWDQLFKSEQDLLTALQLLNVTQYRENGCDYIASYQKQLHSGKQLTSKQVTQLKRLAKFIYNHYTAKQEELLYIV